MGCPSEVKIGQNLFFSICTHDPDTGELSDADAAPTYRIYEDDTGDPIVAGSMVRFDALGAEGLYGKLIHITAGFGYRDGHSYTIYIRASVDTHPGGITYGFKAYNLTISELVQAVPPVNPTLEQAVMLSYMALRNERRTTATMLYICNDAGTVISKSTLSDDGTTFTKSRLISGP